MTIASEANRSGPYACNGATTRFPYAFKIYDEAHIRVILTDETGADATLALGTDYVVSGVGDDGGGAVETALAHPAGRQVTLVLNVPFTQGTDLENQGAYFAETIERALDEGVQRDLQLAEEVARAFKLRASADLVAAGAVFVSDGVGGATGGPSAADIEAARDVAVASEGTAVRAAATAGEKAEAAVAAANRAETAAASVDGVVSYAVEQQLTDGEKARALENLGLDKAMTPFGFTAAEGQSAFDLGMSPTPNACIVSQNGAWLTGGVDYVIAGETLMLATAAEAGDRISGVAISSFEVASAMLPAANLADLGDKAVARANLGLAAGATAAKATVAQAVAGIDDTTFMTPSDVALVTPILQSLSAVNTTQKIALAVIPADASMPQINEGTQILALSITPKRATSNIRVRYAVPTNHTSTSAHCAALFLNGAASAVVATSIYIDGNFGGMLVGEYEFPAGSVSAQTLIVRAGMQATGGFANAAGTTSAGGPFRSTIVAEEIAQ
ncbi:hypothetical protein [Pleomorphomonas sp. JP5]|uniref:hypothetical protein n=1 Tax=Pleomorphomonas sp. JP5 TaxID=2942998 RepID=UPI00204446E1|nr:hypothetical protein [Pleomorphomonas sp. JP5]MCM5557347.1 hypothetical protein [Pleomorphomonas sp. JP5]